MQRVIIIAWLFCVAMVLHEKGFFAEIDIPLVTDSAVADSPFPSDGGWLATIDETGGPISRSITASAKVIKLCKENGITRKLIDPDQEFQEPWKTAVAYAQNYAKENNLTYPITLGRKGGKAFFPQSVPGTLDEYLALIESLE